ncbi:hypothetical protein GFS24_03180 [Chitinophaga sp. SYP-B3965]|uniref:hypothetical protein n=1 Tax=Chitinophaga sp. SYP-B3965 TaxID=2663120 RepID=UPI001299D136|nr:hypothetical protein [Chitinophaga sp. SYP-B3965]MRG44097.1 hypothetical protein [Chitinophaga sp. SYP-B3965]
MRKSILILTLIVLAFAACKKNKAEDPPIDKQQLSFSIDGVWRARIDNRWGQEAYEFYSRDSIYRKLDATLGATEQGTFHIRTFNNPDSLEIRLPNDTLIIAILDHIQIKITKGDSTQLFKKVNWPG